VRAAVVGAGAWGTTVAIHLARKGLPVRLWTRDPERARRMQEERENARHLPSFRFPDGLEVVSDGVGECDFVACAVPTQHIRAVFTALARSLPRVPLVSLSKGIEIGTGLLPSRILESVLDHRGQPTAVLTGPCIAREVAEGKPTAVVVAGDEARMFQEAFSSKRLRVYTSEDKLGCELAGAMKNVIGVAAGIVDGLGLGDNAKASMLTRGIVEIARLGLALGARPATFTGLAGFGDLFTTCVSPLGRNRGVGERIGRGEKVADVLASMTAVAEGVPTTRAVVEIARARGVELPIAEALYGVLFDDVDPHLAINALMGRAARPEQV